MNGFFTGFPPARDWFYGVRTFAASMIALYIAMLMQMPRPYWAMATVYIVSSPFVGPTSSKALYRAIGTLMGAAAAVLFVPMFVQSPYVLVVVIALWTGILLFLSMHLRTANNYALMLAGYTLPMIALPVVRHRVELGAGAVGDDEIATARAYVSEFRYPESDFGVVRTAERYEPRRDQVVMALADGGCLSAWQGPRL